MNINPIKGTPLKNGYPAIMPSNPPKITPINLLFIKDLSVMSRYYTSTNFVKEKGARNSSTYNH